ncbi:MAG: amidase family protein, partial [Myxococcota bacterium]
GGGSIRTPSSACGVFGLKPSRGRNPAGPDVGELWHGAVAEHVLTRSVRDSAAALDITAGPDVGAPYHTPPPTRPFLDEVGADPGALRIAFTTRSLLGERVDPQCVAGVEATAALLGELGHQVVEATPPVERRDFVRAFITMVCGETATDIAYIGRVRGRAVAANELELGTHMMRLLGQSTSAAHFNLACRYLAQASRRIQAFFTDYDVLLTPTLAQPPPPIGSAQPSAIEQRVMRILGALRAGRLMLALRLAELIGARTFEFLAFTPVFNVTGQPAMSIPLHWSDDGLPIGMHFVARYGDEATLFRLAAQLEQARPWADRKPLICAD